MILKLNDKEVKELKALLIADRNNKISEQILLKLRNEQLPKKVPGKRNRQKGHDWERQVVNELKELGFDKAMSSRAGDRFKDSQGIDILNVPIHVQCKRHHNFANPIDALKKMPQRPKVNVILLKIDSIKPDWKEEYAILTKEHFYFMLERSFSC